MSTVRLGASCSVSQTISRCHPLFLVCETPRSEYAGIGPGKRRVANAFLANANAEFRLVAGVATLFRAVLVIDSSDRYC